MKTLINHLLYNHYDLSSIERAISCKSGLLQNANYKEINLPDKIIWEIVKLLGQNGFIMNGVRFGLDKNGFIMAQSRVSATPEPRQIVDAQGDVIDAMYIPNLFAILTDAADLANFLDKLDNTK